MLSSSELNSCCNIIIMYIVQKLKVMRERVCECVCERALTSLSHKSETLQYVAGDLSRVSGAELLPRPQCILYTHNAHFIK